MDAEESVWIFNGSEGSFPGGVFQRMEDAVQWIKKHKLTGVLSKYPLNEGCFDWAVRTGKLSMKKETFERKRHDPEFIGSFTTASQEHYHFEGGLREDERFKE